MYFDPRVARGTCTMHPMGAVSTKYNEGQLGLGVIIVYVGGLNTEVFYTITPYFHMFCHLVGEVLAGKQICIQPSNLKNHIETCLHQTKWFLFHSLKQIMNYCPWYFTHVFAFQFPVMLAPTPPSVSLFHLGSEITLHGKWWSLPPIAWYALDLL